MAVTVPASVSRDYKLVDPGVKQVFFDEFAGLDSVLEKVFHVGTGKGSWEEAISYAGYTDLNQVDELETYSEDAPLYTYGTTITPVKRGKFYPVSWELLQDQREQIAGRTEKYMQAARRSVEKVAASVFNHAFNTSYTSYGDGLPLCSTAHTVTGGGSNQSNASSTSVALTEANLDSLIQSMSEGKDDNGNIVDLQPDTLLVPPKLLKKALEITKSTQRSGIADNDANVYTMAEYNGGMLKVIPWTYLSEAAGGSDTAWFLMDSSKHEITWKWWNRPEIKQLSEDYGAKNDAFYWKIRLRAGFAWYNWRGIYGSKGDASVYSS